MPKSQKSTPFNQKPPLAKDPDKQNFAIISIIFLAVGLGLMINDTTRPTGLPLLILGFTFYVISRSNKSLRKNDK